MPEITNKDAFGSAMRKTVLDFKIYHVLEIGAFDGDGSTVVLARALAQKNAPVSLVSLEYSPERFKNLAANSAEFPFVTPINASSIGKNSFTVWDFETDVWNTPYNGLKYPKEQVREWHQQDVALMHTIDSGYLDSVPAPGPWDAVLIDGGEFAGYDEFRLVKNLTKCFFLDDCFNAFKTNRVRQELANSQEWTLTWEGPHVRNGGAIFVRNDLEKESLLSRFRSRFA